MADGLDTHIRQQETGATTTGVLSADTAVKSAPGKVFWLTIHSTNDVSIELNDSTDNGGTDKWTMVLDVSVQNFGHFIFDPPLEFATGIYFDQSHTSAKTIFCYI